MDPSVAERYKKALIQKEKNIIKAKDLMYGNAQFRDPKYIIEHYENRAQACQENFKHTHTPAEKLLHDAYIAEKKLLAEKIMLNKMLSIPGIDEEVAKQLREELDSLLELDSLSEEEYKIKIAENEEENLLASTGIIKGQFIASELGFVGNKFHLCKNIPALTSNPLLLSNLEEDEISQIANRISSSKEYKKLIHLHNTSRFCNFVNSFSCGIPTLGFMATSFLASSGDYLFTPKHAYETLFALGLGLVTSKVNKTINSKLNKANNEMFINLEDYIPHKPEFNRNNSRKNNVAPIQVDFEDVDPNENDNEPNLNEPLEME